MLNDLRARVHFSELEPVNICVVHAERFKDGVDDGPAHTRPSTKNKKDFLSIFFTI